MAPEDKESAGGVVDPPPPAGARLDSTKLVGLGKIKRNLRCMMVSIVVRGFFSLGKHDRRRSFRSRARGKEKEVPERVILGSRCRESDVFRERGPFDVSQ